MATLEGENASTPVVNQGPDGGLLLPVLGGENAACAAAAAGAPTIPRVSIGPGGITRRSVRPV